MEGGGRGGAGHEGEARGAAARHKGSGVEGLALQPAIAKVVVVVRLGVWMKVHVRVMVAVGGAVRGRGRGDGQRRCGHHLNDGLRQPTTNDTAGGRRQPTTNGAAGGAKRPTTNDAACLPQ